MANNTTSSTITTAGKQSKERTNNVTQTSLPTSIKASSPKSPAGPRGHFLLGNARDLQQSSPSFCLKLAQKYGDVARIRILSKHLYVVSQPDGIRKI
jgi:hypothetical protein